MISEGQVLRRRLRLAVGLGDSEREARLLPALLADGGIAVVEQCLTADRLIEAVREGRADAVLAASDLHRLSGERLDTLIGASARTVVLATDPTAPRWRTLPAVVLPLEADPGLVREGLTAAGIGGRPPSVPVGRGGRRPADAPFAGGPDESGARPPRVETGDASPAAFTPGSALAAGAIPSFEDRAAPAELGRKSAAVTVGLPTPGGAQRARLASEEVTAPGFVLAVASGHGSPGSTTVAVNLAVALGAAAATLLVDASLVAPGVAAVLGLSRTRNLVMLAHDEPRSVEEWDRALAQETQALTVRSPHGRALCGVPRPVLRSAVSGRFLSELIARLRERHAYVVLDLGDVADLDSGDSGVAAAQRAALATADHVCLVARPDPVGVWRAQEARDAVRETTGVTSARISLVLNHYDARRHHRRAEFEWALRLPTAAVVPHDHARVQGALGELRPVVLDDRSAAGRALLDLAERLFGGHLTLPAEPPTAGARPASPSMSSWLRHCLSSLVARGRPTNEQSREGEGDDRSVAPVV